MIFTSACIHCILLRCILISDTLKQKSTTDTSQVTVVGGVLGALLFLSLVAIVCLIIGVLRLGKYKDIPLERHLSSSETHLSTWAVWLYIIIMFGSTKLALIF